MKKKASGGVVKPGVYRIGNGDLETVLINPATYLRVAKEHEGTILINGIPEPITITVSYPIDE